MRKYVLDNFENTQYYVCMLERKVNAQLLGQLIKGTAPHSRLKHAKAMGVSETLLRNLLAGKYRCRLKEATREMICQHFKIPEDVLFPVGSGRQAAS